MKPKQNACVSGSLPAVKYISMVKLLKKLKHIKTSEISYARFKDAIRMCMLPTTIIYVTRPIRPYSVFGEAQIFENPACHANVLLISHIDSTYSYVW